ncbi:glycosyltransferase [Aerococcaceae bacterium 50-4]
MSKSNPKVSVISTVKNGEKTLAMMLESVVNQTYENVELVIVDDGSTDTTLDILNKFKDKYSTIKIIETEGIGRVHALNTAIQESTGEYIVNLDADDLIHPQKIQIQMNEMLKHSDYFLLATDSIIVRDLNTIEWNKLDTQYSEITDVTDRILIRNTINHSSVLMNKEILNELGGYSTHQKSQVDYELWMRAFVNDLKMGIIDSPLTAKRIHSNQSFENKKRFQYTYRSMVLQQKYIFKSGKYKYILFSVASFVLAQLPFNTRQIINQYISKYMDGGRNERS